MYNICEKFENVTVDFVYQCVALHFIKEKKAPNGKLDGIYMHMLWLIYYKSPEKGIEIFKSN